jgi:hypothetical protein
LSNKPSGARSLMSAQKLGLTLHAESGACSLVNFLHTDFLKPDLLKHDFLDHDSFDHDFLEPDALKARPFKRPETAPQKYRHDINVKLVDESRLQELFGYAEAADPADASSAAVRDKLFFEEFTQDQRPAIAKSCAPWLPQNQSTAVHRAVRLWC